MNDLLKIADRNRMHIHTLGDDSEPESKSFNDDVFKNYAKYKKNPVLASIAYRFCPLTTHYIMIDENVVFTGGLKSIQYFIHTA